LALPTRIERSPVELEVGARADDGGGVAVDAIIPDPVMATCVCADWTDVEKNTCTRYSVAAVLVTQRLVPLSPVRVSPRARVTGVTPAHEASVAACTVAVKIALSDVE
jgi:hypothetical protein